MPVQDRADLEGDVGPFVTFVEHVRPDGAVARWESRRHRKHPPGAAAAGSGVAVFCANAGAAVISAKAPTRARRGVVVLV